MANVSNLLAQVKMTPYFADAIQFVTTIRQIALLGHAMYNQTLLLILDCSRNAQSLHNQQQIQFWCDSHLIYQCIEP